MDWKIPLKLFIHGNEITFMADIFDSIPVITVILFAIGLVGVMVYERSRSRQEEESTT